MTSGSKVTAQSVYFMFLVTLTLTFDISRYSRYFSRNHIKYPGISIYSVVTIGSHLTKLWCEIGMLTHRYIITYRQTDRHTNTSITITSFCEINNDSLEFLSQIKPLISK